MTAPANTDRLAWWKEARFGMFIHFGVYSLVSHGEWIYYQEHIPQEEYNRLADQFRPTHYNPREWVRIAQDAGMRYMVMVTRHHDGFCMYDSKVSDFTSTKSAAKRDFIAEFADACHEAGMRMGLYYSLVDWRFPGALFNIPRQADEVYAPMVEQAHAQVREILTNYGKVDILWYDMAVPAGVWRPEELNAMARELQPGILINNRAGTPEDFGTPENAIVPEKRAWEACYTMNETWGYAEGDRNWKSANQLIYLLATCASGGGNLLLNVGPEPDGRFPREAVDRLRQVGAWMRTNGAAIYGAQPSPVTAPALGWGTYAGGKAYLIILRWPGSTVPFAWCANRVLKAKLLITGEEARIEQKGDRVWLHGFPEYPPDNLPSVVELTLEGEPQAAVPSLAFGNKLEV